MDTTDVAPAPTWSMDTTDVDTTEDFVAIASVVYGAVSIATSCLIVAFVQ